MTPGTIDASSDRGKGFPMAQSYTHDTQRTPDDEIRDSIRVIQRERSMKLTMVILATIFGIGALLLAAYLGFTT